MGEEAYHGRTLDFKKLLEIVPRYPIFVSRFFPS